MSSGKQKPQRVGAYIRISALMDRVQGEDLMSDRIQREKIEAWATFQGAEVVEVYEDIDRSGRKGKKRPAFERLMREARAGKLDTIAVYRWSRLGRHAAGALAVLDELDELGVRFVSVEENLDTSSPMGRFVRLVLVGLAEYQGETIGEEWKVVHAARRQRGLAHVPSGAYGYTTKNANGEPTATIQGIDEEQAEAVRLMYRLRDEGVGYGRIQDELERHGFRSPRKHPRFAKTTILAILRNPIYAGLVRARDGELVEGQHEAIVDRNVWERVQALHKRTNTVSRHGSGALLAGLLKCSGCGYAMRYEAARGGKKARYRCPAKDLGEPCDQPVQIVAERAEAAIEEAFLRRFDPRRFPNGGRVRSDPGAEWRRAATRARTRVAAIDGALDELTDARFVTGTVSADQYVRQAARLEQERGQEHAKAEEAEALAAAARPLDAHVFELWDESPTDVKRRGFGVVMAEVLCLPYDGKPGAGRFNDAAERLKVAWTT